MFEFELKLKMELADLRKRIKQGYTLELSADEMEDKERLAELEEQAIECGIE